MLETTLHLDLLDKIEVKKAPEWVQTLMANKAIRRAYGPGDFHVDVEGKTISLYEGDILGIAQGKIYFIRK